MKHRRLMNGLIALAVLLLVAGFAVKPAAAQVLYGSVVGTVEDPSGSVVPGAAVSLVNTETGTTRDVQADDQGRYNLVNLPAGTYNLVVTAPVSARRLAPVSLSPSIPSPVSMPASKSGR